MKTIKNTFLTLAITGLTLLSVGCGTEGTTFTNFSNTSLNFDFRVTSSSPINGATGINASTTHVQLFFSEEVDPATMANNIIVKHDTSSGLADLNGFDTNTDIDVNGSMLDIDLGLGNSNASLIENTVYYVILMPGLTSTNNNQLYDGNYPAGVQVAFNTGTGFGNSVAGAPKVSSIQKYTNFNGCFSAQIRFNEDVSLYINDITMESNGFLGLGGGIIDAIVQPLYSYRQDVWVIEAQCSLLGVSGIWEDITVRVNDAVDIDGNHVDCSASDCDKTF